MMANDWIAQAESLKKLPAPFWSSLKKEEAKLARAADSLLPLYGHKDAGTLTACLAHTFELEEPIILSIYAPLIRHLRTAWTDLALDFYVVVRVHVSRLARLIQTYAGDPALNLRCSILLLNLEKEVQKQDESLIKTAVRPARQNAAARKHLEKTPAKRNKLSVAKARPTRASDRRPKPLVKKIEIARRRARR